MNTIQALITEINQEAGNTKKILNCVPEEKFDWKPHEKSMSLKALSTHIVQLSSWPGLVASTKELDFQNNSMKTPEINDTQDLIKALESGIEDTLAVLKSTSEEELSAQWILRSGENIIFEMPKIAVIRGMSMNHLIHHRGQLSVYLRLLDIAIPGMYGPSADER